MAKVKQSAVMMLEYGAARVWHTEFSDIFIDRDEDNSSWWLVKMYPKRIEFYASDIEKLRAVSSHEFGVDVDAAMWTA